MNWLKEIQIAAFKDELQKLAKIDVDDNGNVIYHSKDADNPKKKADDVRNGYEMYTEDSASGSQELHTEPTPN